MIVAPLNIEGYNITLFVEGTEQKPMVLTL